MVVQADLISLAAAAKDELRAHEAQLAAMARDSAADAAAMATHAASAEHHVTCRPAAVRAGT